MVLASRTVVTVATTVYLSGASYTFLLRLLPN